MAHQLAQLNIANFRLPAEHPDNHDFVSNLDRVNAIAEAQPGFVWRLKGEGNDALDLQAFDDPNVISNMSVWADLDSLAAFVYRNEEHRQIMRRRKEWFDKMEFHLVLWWVKEGHIPTLHEAIKRLDSLQANGPTEYAFTFRYTYPSPSGQRGDIKPVLDECG